MIGPCGTTSFIITTTQASTRWAAVTSKTSSGSRTWSSELQFVLKKQKRIVIWMREKPLLFNDVTNHHYNWKYCESLWKFHDNFDTICFNKRSLYNSKHEGKWYRVLMNKLLLSFFLRFVMKKAFQILKYSEIGSIYSKRKNRKTNWRVFTVKNMYARLYFILKNLKIGENIFLLRLPEPKFLRFNL